MAKLRFETSLQAPSVDAALGRTLFEVKQEIRDVRMLRAMFLEMANLAAIKPDHRTTIILDRPQLTEARIDAEWDRLRGVIRPTVLSRMSLVIYHEANDLRVHGSLTREERGHLAGIVQHTQQRPALKIHRPSPAYFDVLRVLLIHWFRRSGPLTSKDLAAQAGCSYPTLAAALETLEPYLTRYSDRKVTLREFPQEAWIQLTSQAEKVRDARRYGDISGRPSPVSKLLERLGELAREDIAVGGVVGARHYLPGIDLVGTPRLDLVVHATQRESSDDFLRSMDPALKPVGRGQPAQVVVHRIYRPVSFFRKLAGGLPCADEIECLMDLQDAGLESQAQEFREHFTTL